MNFDADQIMRFVNGPVDGRQHNVNARSKKFLIPLCGPFEWGSYVYERVGDSNTAKYAGFQPCNCEDCIERRGYHDFQPSRECDSKA
jgi:hypothetical protein